jgi:hypothetical protein
LHWFIYRFALYSRWWEACFHSLNDSDLYNESHLLLMQPFAYPCNTQLVSDSGTVLSIEA